MKSRFQKIFGFRISRKHKKGTHFFRKRERVLPGFRKTWGGTLSLSEREPALFEKKEIYCSAFLVFFSKKDFLMDLLFVLPRNLKPRLVLPRKSKKSGFVGTAIGNTIGNAIGYSY